MTDFEDFTHPEATCQRCGRDNIVWFAPNDVWNRVMPDDGGILCPVCFVQAAERAGIAAVWRLAPESDVRELESQLTLARQAADQVWDATDALCVAGDCNCPVDTCVISLRQEVVRLTAQARQMWEDREGWKRTASERGFELNALREQLAAGESRTRSG